MSSGKRASAYVRDASERARLHLEVRVAMRPRDLLASLLQPTRGPVRIPALRRKVERTTARAPHVRAGLLCAACAGGIVKGAQPAGRGLAFSTEWWVSPSCHHLANVRQRVVKTKTKGGTLNSAIAKPSDDVIIAVLGAPVPVIAAMVLLSCLAWACESISKSSTRTIGLNPLWCSLIQGH